MRFSLKVLMAGIGAVACLVLLKTAPLLDTTPAGIASSFRDIRAKEPGAIITISRQGQVVYQQSFGLSDTKARTPITGTSVFDLASCSKAFTAMAVLMLYERGQLSLDADVSVYLNEFKGPANVRVRDLLNMTSGLADYSVNFSREQIAKMSMSDIVAWTAKQPHKAAALQQYDYNNGNYVLLAAIVDRLSGHGFAAFLTDEIFKPLGMNNTVVMTAPSQQIANRVSPYSWQKSKWRHSQHDGFVYGDGQVFTTADDFALWDKALGDGKLVKASTLKLAFSGVYLSNGRFSGYGMGWGVVVNAQGETVMVNHSGSWSGTSTYITRNLVTGETIMILSNRENFDVYKYAARIERELAKQRKNKVLRPF